MQRPSCNTAICSLQETAHQRVIRQLVEALLFEQAIPCEFACNTFYFTLGASYYKAEGKRGACGRIRLNRGHSVLHKRPPHQHFTPVTLEQIIDDLPVKDAQRNTLQRELKQTLSVNLWNQQHLPLWSERSELPIEQLELALHEGHAYHPCFKTRTGFSLNDHIKYSSEFGNTITPNWLAVKRSYSAHHGSADVLTFSNLISRPSQLALYEQLRRYKINPDDVTLIPVHPWQYQVLRDHLSELIQQNHLWVLENIPEHYTATISLRTLRNRNPLLPDIKLPLSVVCTSSSRTLDPMTICAAPALSEWLNTIVKSDAFLQKHYLAIQTEFAGITLTGQVNAETAIPPRLNHQLGCLFRSPISFHNQHGLCYGSALSAIEANGVPFIHHWVTRHGCMQWVYALVNAVVIPLWHLLVHHGIAVEAHGQNLLIKHREGLPYGCVIKDFHESLEFNYQFLRNPANAPDFNTLNQAFSDADDNQFYWMKHPDQLLELFTDTVMVYLLSDISYLMSEVYGFTETVFWAVVESEIARYNRSGLTSGQRIEQIKLSRPQWKVESLFTHKLLGMRSDSLHHTIANPLFEKLPTQSETLNVHYR